MRTFVGLAAMTATLLVASCKQDEPKEPQSKRHSEDPGSANAEPAADAADAGVGEPPAEPSELPEVVDETPEEQQGDDEPAGTDDDGGDDDEPTKDPQMLTRSDWYRAAYDVATLRGVRNDRGVVELNGVLERRIRDLLTTTPTDGQTVSATFGDGRGARVVSCEVVNTAEARQFAMAAQEATSGACPKGAQCARQIVVKPDGGEAVTACFSALFPFAPQETLSAVEMLGLAGSYGPFKVTTYAGDAVACDAPATAPLATEDVTVTVAAVDAAAIPLTMHRKSPLSLDLAVSFTTTRMANDTRAPYLDETVGIASRNVYALNVEKHVIVKQVETRRTNENAAWLDDAIGPFAGIDGIVVDRAYELCQDKLAPDAPGYCD